MFNNWKERILSGWNILRVIRLGLALLVIYESIKNYDVMFAILGSVILFQAVLNFGCCGQDGCAVNTNSNKQTDIINSKEEVSFTEVK